MTNDTINKVKREVTIWEKIFAIRIGNEGLIVTIYKILLQINTAKINNPTVKQTQSINRKFLDEIPVNNNHENMLNISATRKMQIKTIYNFLLLE